MLRRLRFAAPLLVLAAAFTPILSAETRLTVGAALADFTIPN